MICNIQINFQQVEQLRGSDIGFKFCYWCWRLVVIQVAFLYRQKQGSLSTPLSNNFVSIIPVNLLNTRCKGIYFHWHFQKFLILFAKKVWNVPFYFVSLCRNLRVCVFRDNMLYI